MDEGATELMVMIEGIDQRMTRRRSLVSSTGILFEADRQLTDVGCLEYLHVSTLDKTRGLTVMAQLKHLIPSDEAGLIGHAFEMFPQSDDVQAQIDALLEVVGPAVLPQMEAEPVLAAATILRLTIDKLSFRSSWPIAVGSKVQLAITSVDGKARLPFEGHVLSTRADGPSHHVDVDLASAGVRSAPMSSNATHADSITGSIDLLFGQGMVSEDLQTKSDRHLVGRLDRVPLTGLLMLFDMERISGELAIVVSEGRFTLFLREGKLIDAVPASDAELRNVLQRIAAMSTGKFEFKRCDVDRADRVKTSTTALLIDLARERDESATGSAAP